MQGFKLLWEITNQSGSTLHSYLSVHCLLKQMDKPVIFLLGNRQNRHIDTTVSSSLLSHSYVHMQCSYSSLSINIFHSFPQGEHTNTKFWRKAHLQQCWLTEHFPFVDDHKERLLAALWLSHHTAWAPFMFFPCCNLLTELGLGQKKSVSLPIIIRQGGEAVWQGWGWDT